MTPKEVLEDLIDALKSGDLDRMSSRFAEDATWEIYGSAPIPPPKRSRTEITDGHLATATTLFDPQTVQFDVLSTTSEDDRVVLEWRLRAKTLDGRTYDNRYLAVYVVQEDLVREVREYTDTAYMAKTLFS